LDAGNQSAAALHAQPGIQGEVKDNQIRKGDEIQPFPTLSAYIHFVQP